MNFKRLKLMRSAARVQRMHTMPCTYRQSVGEHTFGLLAIMDDIFGLEDRSSRLIVAALYHDVAEAITGDTPAPVKWAHPLLEIELKAAEARIDKEFGIPDFSLSAFEIRILKYCDLMELAMFALEEVDTGNKVMAVVAWNALNAVKKRSLEHITEESLALWKQVGSDYVGRCGATGTFGEDCYHGWPAY